MIKRRQPAEESGVFVLFMLKKLTISITIQLASIPVLYWMLYTIAKVFHEPYVRGGSDGMDFYGLTLMCLAWFVALTLPVLNIVIELVVKNKLVSTLIHSAWFIFIATFTIGDLRYRPYDYGLILFCIGTTIGSRLFIERLIGKSQRRIQ